MVVYLFHLLAFFGHAIIVLNNSSQIEEQFRLKDAEKMVNWILFTLFLYYFLKTAQSFINDFKKLMNNQKPNEEKSWKRQLKYAKSAGILSSIVSLWIYIRFYLRVEHDPLDQRLRLMYMPIVLCVLTAVQAWQMHKFFNMKQFVDTTQIKKKK